MKGRKIAAEGIVLATLTAIFMVGSAWVAKGNPADLVYDDFDDGALGTNIGGAAGAMSAGGLWDPTINFTPQSHDGAYALSMTYNFSAGQWCGYWSFFKADESGYDVSGYTALEMWVKGASGDEKFKVEVTDIYYNPDNYQATQNHKRAISITSIEGFQNGLTPSWQLLSIPLSKFTEGSSQVDNTKLKQINLIFDHPGSTSGTIFVDTIKFTTGTTKVEVSPSAQTVALGANFNVSIRVTPATGISGVQAMLRFNKDILTATNATGGGLLGGSSFFYSEIDNENGIVTLLGTTFGGATVSAPGVFATITFRADNLGTSNLTLENVIVVTVENGSVIQVSSSASNGSVAVITTQAWDVNYDGHVDLLDLAEVGLHYGESGAPGWIRADVVPDGTINLLDLSTVALHFGE